MADDTPLPPPSDRHSSRLSLPLGWRLPLLTLVASTTGLCLGIAHGSTETALRFRAENAHRLPTTQTGWYLYHKSKNYHVILGGVKEGFRMGGRLAVWSGLFVVMEEGVDRGRAAAWREWRAHAPSWQGREVEERAAERQRDFMSTVLAGLGTAGAFSAWNGFPVPTAVRLMKMGAKAGLVFGVLQDGVSLLRGRKLGYVEFVRRHAFGQGGEDVRDDKTAMAG